jgi:hypothetical protein
MAREGSMSRKLAVLAVLTAVLVALPVKANEKATEAYQKAEKGLQAANNTLRNNVKNIDYPGLQKDAAAFKESFAEMLQFWQEKKADDAVKFIQDGLKAAGDLEAAALAMNYNGVLAAQNAIVGSNGVAFEGGALPGVCVGCHLAHRQRMPDGSFEVK